MRDSKERFSDRVDAYVRYRPRYPSEVLGIVDEEIPLGPQAVVADIGSGTGFSSALFLDRGQRVYAVEPNAEMRRAAERFYGDRAGFVSVPGSAEATSLESRSVDLVVCAQAFHWFDPVAARAEFLRILRPPQWVVLMWNVRLTRESEFLIGYEAPLDRFGTDYAQVRDAWVDDAAIGRLFQGGHARRSVPYEQRFDYEGLKGRLLSSSYALPPNHPNHRPMLSALRALFDAQQVGGEVRMLYRTDICAGRLT